MLGTGQVSAGDVSALLGRCRGPRYSSAPHHFDADTTVHVFQPVKDEVRWYIKLYFVTYEDIDVMFMNVHETVYGRG